MRHGFLNLVAATAFAELGWDEEQILDVVVETEPAAFTLTAAGMAWRGQNATMRDLRRARGRFAAYGSCSFDEPTEDLVALGMLELDDRRNERPRTRELAHRGCR